MQAFQTASAAFCLACICAEIVELLTGSGWTRRCIKAVAGLYILIVLLRFLPGMRVELQKAQPDSIAPASLPSAQTQILAQTQAALQQKLQEECTARFGITLRLEITLEQADETIRASKVVVHAPAGANTQEITAFLRQELGTEEVLWAEEAD